MPPAPPAIVETTLVRQNPRVACRVYDGQAEVITLDEPIRQHRLNRVGTRVWELAERGATAEAMGRQLAREFTVDEETARRDALAFCRDLVARGILVVGDDGGGEGSEGEGR